MKCWGPKIDFTLKFDLETLRLQAITRNSGSKVAGPRHNFPADATKEGGWHPNLAGGVAVWAWMVYILKWAYPKIQLRISNLGVSLIWETYILQKNMCIIYIYIAENMFNKHGHILDSLREYQNTAVYGRPSVLISLAWLLFALSSSTRLTQTMITLRPQGVYLASSPLIPTGLCTANSAAEWKGWNSDHRFQNCWWHLGTITTDGFQPASWTTHVEE